MKKLAKQPSDADSREYEKDPRFIEYIKRRLELSYDKKNLTDGHEATRRIRKKLNLPVYE